MNLLSKLIGKKPVKETSQIQSSGNPEYDKLIDELITIAANTEDENESGFFKKDDEGLYQRCERAREIGKQLYYMGNRSIIIMTKAKHHIETVISQKAGSDLSYCWHEIGLKYYKRKHGSSWLH
ncbi:MAG: hypothetical protein HKN08_09105 [Gammaproteobacteria bacterium]|nr:hypothetical protein [Gammaproteobacteria bacterium]